MTDRRFVARPEGLFVTVRVAQETSPAVNQWLAHAAPLDRSGWNLSAGIRAAIAVSVPVLLAEFLTQPGWSWVGIVAFWGCMVDHGGAWHDRFVALTGFTLLATLGVMIGLLAEPSPVLAVLVTLIWCFFCGMLRIYGDTASSVGLLLISDMMVTLGIPSMNSHAIIDRPLLTLIGGLWAGLLVLVIWRLYPLAPGRRALAHCWLTIGAYTNAIAKLHEGNAAHSDEDWAAVARDHRRASREALEAARTILTDLRKGRSGESTRVHMLIDLISDADQTFERVIALENLLALESGAGETTLRALMVALHRLARQASAVAATIQNQRPRQKRSVTRSIASLRRSLSVLEGGGTALQRAVPLIEEISVLMDGAVEAASGVRAPKKLSEAIVQPGRQVSLGSIWSNFRANLNYESVFLRHAVRLALTGAIAQIIVRVFELPRGYWVTMTAAIILQPFMAMTWRRAIERVIGSVMGGLIAAGLGLVLRSPIEIAVAVFPLTVLTMAVRSVNYTLFVFCLTPTFVLIAELFQGGGSGDWSLAGLRALDSACGGILGLIAGFALWPSWEGPVLAARLASAVRGTRDFMVAALSDTDSAALQTIRRQAGLASNNAEASLQRLLGEPRRDSPEETGSAMVIVTSLRRLAGIATVLGITRPEGLTNLVRRMMGEFGPWMRESLDAIADAVERHVPPVPLKPSPASEIDRSGLNDDDLLSLRELDLAKSQVLLLASSADRLGRVSR